VSRERAIARRDGEGVEVVRGEVEVPQAVADGEYKLQGTILSTGYVPPEDMSYEDWEREGQILWFMMTWAPWAVGDWIEFGAKHYPNRYEQGVSVTGRKIKTLYNKSYLSRQFPPEIRSEVLSPSHHGVLAGMPDNKKVKYLKEGEKLDKDSNGHLTVQAFEQHVRDQENANSDAKVEVVDAPAPCSDCFGSGKCSRCHGSGEDPVIRKEVGR
jgi:hypothetical protein